MTEGKDSEGPRYGCANCGLSFSHHPRMLNLGGLPARTYYFCSPECFTKGPTRWLEPPTAGQGPGVDARALIENEARKLEADHSAKLRKLAHQIDNIEELKGRVDRLYSMLFPTPIEASSLTKLVRQTVHEALSEREPTPDRSISGSVGSSPSQVHVAHGGLGSGSPEAHPNDSVFRTMLAQTQSDARDCYDAVLALGDHFGPMLQGGPETEGLIAQPVNPEVTPIVEALGQLNTIIRNTRIQVDSIRARSQF